MLFINHNNNDPYFNHSAEEYVLKNFDDECFMLWQNSPCILIGKNQNALAEINMEYIKENNITVVRRLSGGGAVFNDLGNFNFTFITKKEGDINENFSKFTIPILKALKALGVDAEFSGRNDLTIEGKKFSGNAQYYYKDKVLHHGTLLFSINMSNLCNALNVRPIKFKDKGVKSVESRVTNISSHLKNPMSLLEFKDYLMNYVINLYGSSKLYKFTEKDLEEIDKIAKNRFSTWEWNFGSSPKYKFSNEDKLKAGVIEVNFEVDKGCLSNVKFYGDFFGKKDIALLEKALIGTKHDKNELFLKLQELKIEDYINNINLEELVELMF